MVWIESPTPQAYATFGRSIAMSGGQILIGDTGSEKAYLYDAATGVLEQTYSDQWTDRGPFGGTVGFAGNRPMIGTDFGPIRVFDPVTGAVLATITVPYGDALPTNYIGRISLAGSGDMLAIGNAGVQTYFNGAFRGDSGAAYFYEAPEPATLSLLALGTLALLRRRWK